MKSNSVQYSLVVMWLVGFVICLAPVFMAYNDIPNLFQRLLNQIVETFIPQIAIMIAFIFSDRLTKQKVKTVNKFTSILALAISFCYLLFYSIVLIQFQVEKTKAIQLIELIESFRPKTSFIVVGIVTYFFASRH